MGWTAPRDWTTGEVVTEAMMDTHVKDNLRYLKGLDGVPTIESGLIIDNTGGDEYLQIPSLTTAERDLLTPVNGMLIYNETTTEFNKYENGFWVDLADNTDHGGLDGLGDDDHTQYALRTILTTRGDIIYRDASNWARLAKGTAGYYLKQGANDPEWASAALSPTSGTYTGDSTVNRAIPHGLGATPKLVIIHRDASTQVGTIMTADASVHNLQTDVTLAVTAMDATNFYVGNATSYANSMNLDTAPYSWVAIG